MRIPSRDATELGFHPLNMQATIDLELFHGFGVFASEGEEAMHNTNVRRVFNTWQETELSGMVMEAYL